MRQHGGEYCFQDEHGHWNSKSQACSYEVTAALKSLELSHEKAKQRFTADNIKREMCKDGRGPCRNGGACKVEMNEDEDKVLSWCKCSKGYTGDWCQTGE